MKSIKEEFFTEMRRKPFLTFLIKWFYKGEEFDDIHIAKCLSSMITHCLIEMERKHSVVFKALDIDFQMKHLSKFIDGDYSAEELKSLYESKFARFIRKPE